MLSFESFVRLGWSFFKTVLRNIFPRRTELPRFLEQYRPDGMLRALPGDSAVQTGASRCIGCGACDLRAVELGLRDALGRNGPQAFVRGASRQAGIDMGFAAKADERVLRELEACCPVAVPFVALAALVRRRHDDWRAQEG